MPTKTKRSVGRPHDYGDVDVASRLCNLFDTYIRGRVSTKRWVTEEKRFAAFLETVEREFPEIHPLLLFWRVRKYQPTATLSRNLLRPPTEREELYLRSMENGLRQSSFMQLTNLQVRRKVRNERHEHDDQTLRSRVFWRSFTTKHGKILRSTALRSDEQEPRTWQTLSREDGQWLEEVWKLVDTLRSNQSDTVEL